MSASFPNRRHASTRPAAPGRRRWALPAATWLLMAGAADALAQRWELGIGAGGGIYTTQSVTNVRGQSAEAGVAPGPVITAHLGQMTRGLFGGEVRYSFQRGAYRLRQAGLEARLSGHSHAIEYDVLLHFAGPAARLRPYLLAGAGAKYFEGTGRETSVQPLTNFAFLTRTSEWQPLVAVAGGLKISLSRHIELRLEARDTLTPVPKNVITPARGATLGGWLHDLALLGTVAFRF